MKTSILHLNDMNEQYFDYRNYLYSKGGSNAKSREGMAKYLIRCIENGLTKKQKTCFSMVVLEGRKAKDVAEELKLSASTVSRHVNAAKRKLKKYSEFLGK